MLVLARNVAGVHQLALGPYRFGTCVAVWTGTDIWLPRHCIIRTSDATHDFRVTSVSRAPIAPDDFLLKPDREGALITDETLPKGPLNFQIPAPPDQLDSAELTLARPEVAPNYAWPVAFLAAIVLAGLAWKLRGKSVSGQT